MPAASSATAAGSYPSFSLPADNPVAIGSTPRCYLAPVCRPGNNPSYRRFHRGRSRRKPEARHRAPAHRGHCNIGTDAVAVRHAPIAIGLRPSCRSGRPSSRRSGDRQESGCEKKLFHGRSPSLRPGLEPPGATTGRHSAFAHNIRRFVRQRYAATSPHQQNLLNFNVISLIDTTKR